MSLLEHRQNFKVSLAWSEAGSDDIVVLHTSNTTHSLAFAIDSNSTSIIIRLSLSSSSFSNCSSLSNSISLSSFFSLSNCPSFNSLSNCSSFPSFSTQFSFSLFLLEPSGRYYVGLKLLLRFLVLVFCAVLAAVTDDCISAVALG